VKGTAHLAGGEGDRSSQRRYLDGLPLKPVCSCLEGVTGRDVWADLATTRTLVFGQHKLARARRVSSGSPNKVDTRARSKDNLGEGGAETGNSRRAIQQT
jgi:hypothetical protein